MSDLTQNQHLSIQHGEPREVLQVLLQMFVRRASRGLCHCALATRLLVLGILDADPDRNVLPSQTKAASRICPPNLSASQPHILRAPTTALLACSAPCPICEA